MLLPVRQRLPEGRCKCSWAGAGFTRDLLRRDPARWGRSMMAMAEHAALRGESCCQATRNLPSTQSWLASFQGPRERAADQLAGPNGIQVTARNCKCVSARSLKQQHAGERGHVMPERSDHCGDLQCRCWTATFSYHTISITLFGLASGIPTFFFTV